MVRQGRLKEGRSVLPFGCAQVATPGGAGCCQAGYPGALMHVAGGKFEPHDFSKDGAAEMLVLTIDECDNYDDRKGSSAQAICPRMASRLEVRRRLKEMTCW